MAWWIEEKGRCGHVPRVERAVGLHSSCAARKPIGLLKWFVTVDLLGSSDGDAPTSKMEEAEGRGGKVPPQLINEIHRLAGSNIATQCRPAIPSACVR